MSEEGFGENQIKNSNKPAELAKTYKDLPQGKINVLIY